MGMPNEEREKHIRIANMLIGVINDLERPMLMYQIEKDVTREALENYIKMLEQTDKVEESNFSTEQYKADLQGAYDCGYNSGYADAMNDIAESEG